MKIFLDFPDNVTNGDVLKALFPNVWQKEERYFKDTISWYPKLPSGLHDEVHFDESWWNSPYGKEKEKPIIMYSDLEEEDDI